jgi:DNA-binding MarR family transcriptional regulator
MTQKDPIQEALRVFAKLYFFMPAMKPDIVQIGSETVAIKEPMDAVLWLLEELLTDTQDTKCPHSELMKLVLWWYPHWLGKEPADAISGGRAKFARAISPLVSQGLIDVQDVPKDRRQHSIMLTKKGKLVLASIKSQREKQIKVLFEKLTKTQQDTWVRALGEAAKITWASMREPNQLPIAPAHSPKRRNARAKGRQRIKPTP